MHLSAQLFGNALYFHHLIGLDGDFEARTRDFGREDKTDTGVSMSWSYTECHNLTGIIFVKNFNSPTDLESLKPFRRNGEKFSPKQFSLSYGLIP